MVACAACDEWFHGRCVGITEAEKQRQVSNDPSWLCPVCRKKQAWAELGGNNCDKL
jgi:hypothetical protein